jgi:hypothetical protein
MASAINVIKTNTTTIDNNLSTMAILVEQTAIAKISIVWLDLPQADKGVCPWTNESFRNFLVIRKNRRLGPINRLQDKRDNQGG